MKMELKFLKLHKNKDHLVHMQILDSMPLLTKPAIGVGRQLIFLMMPGLILLIKLKRKSHMIFC